MSNVNYTGEKDLNMEKIIYIQLLNEGTKVYRPVPAFEIRGNIFRIEGHDIYEPESEAWEFPPETKVMVEEQVLGGELVLVAVKKWSEEKDE